MCKGEEKVLFIISDSKNFSTSSSRNLLLHFSSFHQYIKYLRHSIFISFHPSNLILFQEFHNCISSLIVWFEIALIVLHIQELFFISFYPASKRLFISSSATWIAKGFLVDKTSLVLYFSLGSNLSLRCKREMLLFHQFCSSSPLLRFFFHPTMLREYSCRSRSLVFPASFLQSFL